MDDSDSATIPRPAKVSIQREVMSRRVRAAISEPVWTLSRALLSPTASLRTLPDYLLIGCQRCGTTSLQAVLSQHPSVKSARLMKGVHYFDTAYDRELNWYRSYFPTNAYRRRHDARAGGRLVVGECSPYYIFHPLALERIAKDLPDVKLIVLFRGPSRTSDLSSQARGSAGQRDTGASRGARRRARSARRRSREDRGGGTALQQLRASDVFIRLAWPLRGAVPQPCSATFRPTGSWSFPAKASSPHPRRPMSEC